MSIQRAGVGDMGAPHNSMVVTFVARVLRSQYNVLAWVLG